MRNLAFVVLTACDSVAGTDRAAPGAELSLELAGRYQQNCASCHEAGAADAPRRGDEQDWSHRRSRGQDVLLERVRYGTVAMPPRGLCWDCSDAELVALVRYVSGGDALSADAPESGQPP